MEKKQLVNILSHYSSSSSEEAREVLDLKSEYPYSQLFHILAARFGKDHQWDDQQSLLQTAAVYTTDRTVLKNVMSVAYQQPVLKVDETIEAEVVATPEKEVKINEDIDFADEVIHDLEKLQKLKLDFETMLDSLPGVEAEKPKPKRPPGRPRKTKLEDNDPLIEEIKSTKKKIAPANQKTKEQIEIIDQFIKTQPKISPKPKESKSEDSDLASEGNDFGDHVISETLVDILRKQGKKEKAVEVLKKLIWKFPQKKAYFAAQIEELKK